MILLYITNIEIFYATKIRSAYQILYPQRNTRLLLSYIASKITILN